jgi:hypothetical protein
MFATLAKLKVRWQEMFEKRFYEIQKTCKGTYWILVIEHLESKRIVANGTLILERKFTHSTGLVRGLRLYNYNYL